MRTARHLFLLLLVAVVAACTPSTMLERFADDTKEEIARTYIQRVIDGDLNSLAAELDPAFRTGNELAQLETLRSAIPKETPHVTNLVGYQVVHSVKGSRSQLVYQFGYGSRWLLVTTAWHDLPAGQRVILSLRAQPMERSLQEIHRLSLRHARPRHYFFLACAVSIPVFILVTVVACLRTPIARRKWLWLVFILVGLVQVSLNWTTGEMGLTPVSVVLLGASATAPSIYAPWTVTFALPVGAVVFWLRRRHLVPISPSAIIRTPGHSAAG